MPFDGYTGLIASVAEFLRAMIFYAACREGTGSDDANLPAGHHPSTVMQFLEDFNRN